MSMDASAATVTATWASLTHVDMRLEYETHAGALSDPTATPAGDGHVVTVYNSNLSQYFLYVYMNSGWRGVELV